MRLHRLEVEAFGPFAERSQLDLDAVSAGGLFLVHGPTGSGKTSLLDAICFALFADVPGARSKKGLRSDHAAPTAVPRVLLELTAGGRRLRIERTAEYYRPKKRGQGLLKVQAHVVLHECVGGVWVVRSARHDEVADLVDQLLGLGLAQFATVAVLPQGDFATFLRATPEDRRAVLERLFDIATFRQVEDWLVEERRRSTAHAGAVQGRYQSQLVRLQDALATGADGASALAGTGAGGLAGCGDADLADGGPGDLDEEVTQEHLAALVERLDGEVTVTMAAYDEATGHDRAARQSLESARLVAAARARGDQAMTQRRELTARAETHRVRVHRLAAAARAEVVAGYEQGLARASADVAVAHQRVQELSGVPDQPAPSADTVAQRLRDAETFDAVVAELAAAGDGLVQAQRTQAAAHTAAAQLAQALAAATTVHEDRQAALAVARAALEAAAQAVGDLPALRAAVESAAQRLRLRQDVDEDESRDLELRERLVTAAENAVRAHGQVLELRRRRFEGMAAELAGSLVVGEPCLVCGSPTHPAPARADHLVTDEEITHAEHHADRVDRLRESLELDRQEVRARCAQRRTQLPDDRPATDLARDLVGREADLAQSVQAGAAHTAALMRVETSVREAHEAAQRHSVAQQASARASGSAQAAADSVTRAAQRIADLTARHEGCPCRDGEAPPRPASLADATTAALTPVASEHDGQAEQTVRRHRALVRSLTGLRDAHRDLAEADLRHQRAAEELTSALREQEFTTRDEASMARLDPTSRTALADEIRREDQARAAVEAVLADPDVTAALAAPPPDLAALVAAADERRAALLAAASDQSQAQQRRDAVRRLVPELVDALRSLGPAVQRAAMVRDLADTVTGVGPANDLRMRLTSFVLAARLEKIVHLANERLAAMGGGRYLLEHSDELAAAGRRSGLGLRVLDQWTGQTRETSSLSGGESFMASLALALGLADAVREESGGSDLATLFVDEGFGSLDDDSLEEVLAVLDALREGGRAVGVVSHVAELRTRITHRIVVDKGFSGSSAQTVTPTTGAA